MIILALLPLMDCNAVQSALGALLGLCRGWGHGSPQDGRGSVPQRMTPYKIVSDRTGVRRKGLICRPNQ